MEYLTVFYQVPQPYEKNFFFQELRASSPSPKDPHDQKDGELFMPWVSSSAFLRFRINRSMPVE
jgi:hypothetical protein